MGVFRIGSSVSLRESAGVWSWEGTSVLDGGVESEPKANSSPSMYCTARTRFRTGATAARRTRVNRSEWEGMGVNGCA